MELCAEPARKAAVRHGGVLRHNAELLREQLCTERKQTTFLRRVCKQRSVAWLQQHRVAEPLPVTQCDDGAAFRFAAWYFAAESGGARRFNAALASGRESCRKLMAQIHAQRVGLPPGIILQKRTQKGAQNAGGRKSVNGKFAAVRIETGHHRHTAGLHGTAQIDPEKRETFVPVPEQCFGKAQQQTARFRIAADAAKKQAMRGALAEINGKDGASQCAASDHTRQNAEKTV